MPDAAYQLYAGTPPHVADSDTSKAAAESMRDGITTLQRRIFALIDKSPIGMTADEVEVVLGGAHQTLSARVRELCLLGMIHDCGETRKTRTGRAARVYLAGYAPPPSVRVTPTEALRARTLGAIAAAANDGAAALRSGRDLDARKAFERIAELCW